MWLSIDPSSTATGWILYEPGPDMQSPIVARRWGVITPHAKFHAIERIGMMAMQIAGTAESVDAVLIEIPSGRVNHARNRGGGSGLSIYGFAAGAIWWAASHNCATVYATDESWTGGFSKDKRKAVAQKAVPGYRPAEDRGGDIADAICLAIWFHHLKGERTTQ
jgi:hypothetical protein